VISHFWGKIRAHHRVGLATLELDPEMTSREILSMISSNDPNSASVSSVIGDCFQELMGVSGVLVVGLGNWETGKCLALDGLDSPKFPNAKIPIAITYNSDVIKAKIKAAEMLQFTDKIDEILISLSSQWHIMKVLSVEGFFLYVALDRSCSNIAAAGFKLMQCDRKLATVLKH
jgi:hypothetical protein